MKELEIYTDCAGSLRDLGISFVVIDDNNEEEEIFLFKTNTRRLNKEFNSSAQTSNTSIGELYAMYKVLSYLKDNQDLRAKIYTDSMHVFLLLNDQCEYKKEGLLKNILERCLDIKGNNVEVFWIKGHAGVYGNELANSAAKYAKRNSKIARYHNCPRLKQVLLQSIESYKNLS
jgi:ribonuclease HI